MDASPRPSARLPQSTDNGRVEQWLKEAQDGSRSALGRALEGARTYLLLVARRALDGKLRAKIGASDLVQDTFVAAQRDFGQFRGQTREEFYGWLVAILAHRLAHSVRYFRSTQGRTVDRELPPEAVEAALAVLRDATITPGADAIMREERRRVQAALDQLPENLRAVLVERMWEGATFAEIGQRRNVSAAGARKMWGRATREMHKLLATIE